MKGWTKIQSFSNTYEAEIRRELLQNAKIEAVVINAKDSMFLFGEIDLYVRNQDEKKALIILEQMQGLTKINSFILEKPIKNFQKYLETKNIKTVLKQRDLNKYIIENYELYVENDNVDQVIPYLTGQAIAEWEKISVCTRVRQTRYRVEVLDTHEISNFIIKKRDSDFHLEDITIYVENDKAAEAKKILTELKGWEKIRTYEKFETAELKEDILGKNKIRALIVENNEKFDLFVNTNKVTNAEKILKNTSEWVELQRFNTFLEAENILIELETKNISASILTIQDSVFILGGYAVYTEKRNIEKAINILSQINGRKIEEE